MLAQIFALIKPYQELMLNTKTWVVVTIINIFTDIVLMIVRSAL